MSKPRGEHVEASTTAPTETTYDVFLSHNSADKPAVLELAKRLKSAGIRPFLDAWHLVPGEPWQEALEVAIDTSGSCAVFVGPAGFGTWENEEMRAALSRRVHNQDYRVIPVILPGAVLPARGRLPAFLSRLTWVDFRPGLDDQAAFDRLVNGIRGLAPAETEEDQPDDAPMVSPYRGLEVFDEEHAKFFFGREALTQYLVEQLRTDRFLAVVGASGSGKSSVVRAGLVPHVRAGDLPGSASWNVIIAKPGAHPVESLAAGLASELAVGADALTTRSSVLTALRENERGLHTTIQTLVGSADADARVLIVIDQFEEIFTLCHDDAERSAFVDLILYASSVVGGQTVVVITMRADFFGRCAAIPTLASRVAERDVLVPPMDESEIRSAITRPAEIAGLQFEKGLVDTIIEDLGDAPGSLPLLQHTLLELFEGRRERWMTIDRYHEIGGVQGAIAKRAETIYASLTPDQQAATRRILLRLTEPGEGTEDTRRRATMSELFPTGAPTDDVQTVVNRLADARLVVTSETDTGDEVVDVAHEALIRGWPRLQAWIDENPAALRVHRRLTETATEWSAANRDPSYLYGGQRLDEAASWAAANTTDLNELEGDFLAASEARRSSEIASRRRRLQVAIGSSAIAMVLISLAALVAFVNWRVAVDSERELEARLVVSEAQRIAADSPLDALREEIGALARVPDRKTAAADIHAVLAAQLTTGHVASLGQGVTNTWASPDGRYVVALSEAGGSIWRLTNPERLAELPGNICDVQFPKGIDVGIAEISSSLDCQAGTEFTQELRRLSDGVLLISSPGRIVDDGDPTAHAIVAYRPEADPELISLTDGVSLGTAKRIAVLAGTDRAVVEDDAGARLVDLLDGSPVVDLGKVVPVMDPANGAAIAGRAGDGSCTIWGSRDGERIVSFASTCMRFQLSPDASLGVAWENDGGQIVDLARGRSVATLGANVWRVSFSPASPPTSLVAMRVGAVAQLLRPDGTVIADYNGAIVTEDDFENGAEVRYSPNGAFVFVRVADYFDIPFEDRASLRSTTDGSVVALRSRPGSGEEAGSLSRLVFSPDGAATYAQAYFSNNTSRLYRTSSWAPVDFVADDSPGFLFLPPPIGIVLHGVAPSGIEALTWNELSPVGKLPGAGANEPETFADASPPFVVLTFDETSLLADRNAVILSADGSASVLGPFGVIVSRDEARSWLINDGWIWARLPAPHKLVSLPPSAYVNEFDPTGRWLLSADPANRAAYVLDLEIMASIAGKDLYAMSDQALIHLACAALTGAGELTSPIGGAEEAPCDPHPGG